MIPPVDALKEIRQVVREMDAEINLILDNLSSKQKAEALRAYNQYADRVVELVRAGLAHENRNFPA